jgi:transposase
MLTLPAKIFLCKEPVNMRMSFEGLGTLVEQLFPGELLTGALFLFFNKSHNCLKALFWDRDGFCIWYKRLERGAFASNMQNQTLDRREFLMLLEGITPQKMRPKFFPKRG